MFTMQAVEPVSTLMAAFRAGESDAGARLMELLYPELKRLAASHLRKERQGHSWQPTVLVNELFLEISRIKGLPSSQKSYNDDKAAFFALAGLLMRRLLIHHARPLSQKIEKVPIWSDLRSSPESDLAEVESLLQHLEKIDPILRTVVEMKVFEGYTAEEIASRIGCAPISVYRHWQFARHWLGAKL